MIKSERQIDGPTALALRKQAGKTQHEFWSALGVTQSGGCRYEQSGKIPKPLRTMIYALYVAGVKIDATSADGVSELMRLGKMQGGA